MKHLITIGILAMVAQTALAQSQRRECPGLKTGAPDDKQVLCWLEREQTGKDDCAFNDGAEVSECIQQTEHWCKSALLDDAAVANGCFMANVRTGQLEEALALKRYLRSPTAEVSRCRQALEHLSVKFASAPAGAQLLVDGRPYGKTPVEIELPQHWWSGDVVAKFGEGKGATEVTVLAEELVKAFDKRSCTIAEVNIKGPTPAGPPSAQTPAPLRAKAHRAQIRADEGGGVSVAGVVTTVLGGAGTIAGGVLLALSLTRRADILSASSEGAANEKWTPEHQTRADSVKPLSIGGIAALGAGAALATVGIILLVTHGSSTDESGDAGTGPILHLSGQGIQISGNF